MICVDTCLVIDLVEEPAVWGNMVRAAFANAGQSRFGISPRETCGCLVGPIKQQDVVLIQSYTDAFRQFEALDMADSVHLKAAQLRVRFGIETPDALHVACAQHHRCEALWTNDERLALAPGGLARQVLAA